MEADFAKAAIEEKLAQVKTDQVTTTANVTVSSIGRRLPPRPSWARSDEGATMANRITAAAFAELPKAKK